MSWAAKSTSFEKQSGNSVSSTTVRGDVMMRTHPTGVLTRSLDVVTRELDDARARRELNGGNEDAVARWKREMLELEHARASEGEEQRNLTDSEASQQRNTLQRIVAESEARIEARFANYEKLFIESLGEAFARERRKIRAEMKQHVDEEFVKLRVGTEAEAERQTELLQRLIGESESRTGERFAGLEKLFIESLGEVFGKEHGKICAEMRQHVEEVVKLRVGPRGERGERGVKGDIGARGPEGKPGKPGAVVTIAKWEIDRKNYSAWPVLSDGSTGAPIELRGLFEQFVHDAR
jgi:hypothetical protein